MNIKKIIREEVNKYTIYREYIETMGVYRFIKSNLTIKYGENVIWGPTGRDYSTNNFHKSKTIDRLSGSFLQNGMNDHYKGEIIEYFNQVDPNGVLGHMKGRDEESMYEVMIYRLFYTLIN